MPIVSEAQQLDELAQLQRPLIVGLTINPEALSQIRRNRQRMLGLEEGDGERYGGDYADVDRIRGELVLARRLFARHRWPELDVTKRSVEETAAVNLSTDSGAPAAGARGPGRFAAEAGLVRRRRMRARSWAPDAWYLDHPAHAPSPPPAGRVGAAVLDGLGRAVGDGDPRQLPHRPFAG